MAEPRANTYTTREDKDQSLHGRRQEARPHLLQKQTSSPEREGDTAIGCLLHRPPVRLGIKPETHVRALDRKSNSRPFSARANALATEPPAGAVNLPWPRPVRTSGETIPRSLHSLPRPWSGAASQLPLRPGPTASHFKGTCPAVFTVTPLSDRGGAGHCVSCVFCLWTPRLPALCLALPFKLAYVFISRFTDWKR